MMEQLERIANLLEQLMKDNREFIDFAKARDDKALQIQEAHLHMSRYHYERSVENERRTASEFFGGDDA